VLSASTDAHTLYAFDAANGQQAWSYQTGGRIDSPPTIHRGLALMGSHDGYVYALRLSDGQLAWRFLAAPARRNIVVSGQVESLWPVHGSITIHNGKAFVLAGRHNQADGGVFLWRRDPLTGAIEASTIVTDQVTSETRPEPARADWQGRIGDILSLNAPGTAGSKSQGGFRWNAVDGYRGGLRAERMVKIANRIYGAGGNEIVVWELDEKSKPVGGDRVKPAQVAKDTGRNQAAFAAAGEQFVVVTNRGRGARTTRGPAPTAPPARESSAECHAGSRDPGSRSAPASSPRGGGARRLWCQSTRCPVSGSSPAPACIAAPATRHPRGRSGRRRSRACRRESRGGRSAC